MRFVAMIVALLLLQTGIALEARKGALSNTISSIYVRQASTNCTSGLPARLIFNNCYHSTYDLIRRGLADDIATAHVRSAVRDFVHYAKSTTGSGDTVRLGEVCIPVEHYSSKFTVRWTSVYTESELDDMLMTISNSFYHVSKDAAALPAPSAAQASERDSIWNLFQTELSKPLPQITYANIRFPSTALHAHDGMHDKACIEWKRFSTTSQKSTPADAGLRRVLRTAVALTRAGCDAAGSWQLVRHYTALVHLGIRCVRAEGGALRVPDIFLNMYKAAAIRLLKGAKDKHRLQKAKPLNDAAFDAVFQFEYKRLATFGSWGQPDSHFGPGVTMKNMLAYTVTAADSQLRFAELLSPNIIPVSRVLSPDCSSPLNENGNMRCETSDYYCYFAITWQASSWFHNCCNTLICENLVTVLNEYSSFAECCEKCNQADCAPGLGQETTVHVPSSYDENGVEIHVYI